MYKQIVKISKGVYFIVPFFLVLVDLFFYVSVSFIFLYFFGEEKEMPGLSFLQYDIGLDKKVIVVFLLALIVVFRMLVVSFSQCLFSRSLSEIYTSLGDDFVRVVLKSQHENRAIDLTRIRKVLNSEMNNLFFGLVIPLSFSLAEGVLVFIVFCYAFYLFGFFTLVIAFFLLVSLFIVMLALRKKGLAVGGERSCNEKKRLEYVELLINSGFSVTINSGGAWFCNRFSEVSKGFSSALGTQVVLPFYTKALVDGILLLVAAISVISIDFDIKDSEIAVLAGMVLRVIPSISRISAYLETIRINSVGVRDVSEKLFEMKVSRRKSFESEVVLNILEAIELPGIYIVKGPSGVGKTSAVKKWLPEISENSSVAYLDQSGFVESASLHDYLNLVGVTEIESVIDSVIDAGIPANNLSELSGGQVKFLQFTAVCDKKSSYFVFDEPSVGLDPFLKQRMLNRIVELAKEKVVVVISHDDEFILRLVAQGADLHEL
ncbi:hypothetical protein SAMN03080615_03788 [Amphritea atlantica]|uniref:Uncharacterized protein n=1 Tax=Amphritea atlantica TaxID=355243 RepID=A0A1H9L5Q5_9GAMM|nr:hypothetical protein [Amphritea atlantica]SER06812.1 hypothetical protein SAMN03080615_03788 [Amphritea atlantica]